MLDVPGANNLEITINGGERSTRGRQRGVRGATNLPETGRFWRFQGMTSHSEPREPLHIARRSPPPLQESHSSLLDAWLSFKEIRICS